LPRVTEPFRARHPHMTVRVLSMTSRQIASGLVHGEIDAGMTYLDNEPISHVFTLPLWHEHYLLVLPADHVLAGAETLTWAAAAELRLGLLTPDMQHRRIVDSAFTAAGATPRPAVETNSVSTLIAHARAGLPCVSAHTWLIANPLPDELRAIPLVEPEMERTIGLVTADSDVRTPVLDELLALVPPFGFERGQTIRRPVSAVE
jgi:DNA-binding transcriptional LysR family regulator